MYKETLREVRRARRSPPRKHSGERLFWEGKGKAQQASLCARKDILCERCVYRYYIKLHHITVLSMDRNCRLARQYINTVHCWFFF